MTVSWSIRATPWTSSCGTRHSIRNYFARRISVQVDLTLPQGWDYGTALETDRRDW